MQLPKIIHCGQYHRANPYHCQNIHDFWLEFYVRGIVRCDVYYPDKHLFFSTGSDRTPELVLYPPGCKMYHQYSPSRCNWVFCFSMSDLKYDRTKHLLELTDDTILYSLPVRIPVAESDIKILDRQLEEIHRLFNEGIPAGKLLAESCLFNFLLRYFAFPVRSGQVTPAEKLKQLIDRSSNTGKNLDILAQECGYSADYLRKQFFREFHVLPRQYQDQKRIQSIMQKIIYTDMTLKEIADSVGIAHTSYLNRLLKDHCGKTPRELCKIYRG